MASRVSSDVRFMICVTPSRQRLGHPHRKPPSSIALVADRASGGPAASRQAHSATKPSSSSLGTTRLTSPKSAASEALRMSPKKANSFALCSPTRRGSNQLPPKSSDSPRGEDLGEAGHAARDDQIAPEGKVAAGADGDALDLGDGRLREAMESQRRVADDSHVAHLVHVVHLRVRQIGAGAERASGTGDDHDPVLRPPAGLGEHLGQLAPHRDRRRVAPFGAVQGDGEHSGRALDDQSVHVCNIISAMPRRPPDRRPRRPTRGSASLAAQARRGTPRSLRRGPDGLRRCAVEKNPAIPGDEDLHLSGLRTGDPRRYRAFRHRPGLGSRPTGATGTRPAGEHRGRRRPTGR